MLKDLQLAFVGSGKMAEAMFGGLLSKKLVKPENIIATGPRLKRARDLELKYKIKASTKNVDALAADVITLAVKPQSMPKVIQELKGKVDKKTLVISIAAGITLKKLAELEVKHTVRAMPNTPGQISRGITVWTSQNGTDGHKKQTAAILRALGKEVFVDDEKYLDMATALSGTGPAYVFLFIEALVDAGLRMGLPRHLSKQLVLETVAGSALYAGKVGEHPALLRDNVTSPAGTTAEALFHLEQAGFRTALAVAVNAAYERSKALGAMQTEK